MQERGLNREYISWVDSEILQKLEVHLLQVLDLQ